jgi:redox-sensitive bicupin YhaK (pirin superfamily)
MRGIKNIIGSSPTLEGAGVRLKRVFGFHEVPQFDPFLLLDHFGSDNPDDYVRGFPWHPHRGIETVTYMIDGNVEHGDSLGNKGIITSGDVQWMTAGSGIIHQEMPKPFEGEMKGFQLWVNLPKEHKMSSPRYRSITRTDIVTVEREGVTVRIIAGMIDGKEGPVSDLFVDIEYLDIELTGTFRHQTRKRTVFVFVYEGSASVGGKEVSEGQCALLEDKGDILIESKGSKFLFVAGNPLGEPIAWGGPIVMNTREELDQAFGELREGTFIKGPSPFTVAEDFYRK